LVIDVVKQVIQRHPEVQNEGIPETMTGKNQKFAMRQKMIDDLHLDQSKTT
jgi:hypothetical protein